MPNKQDYSKHTYPGSKPHPIHVYMGVKSLDLLQKNMHIMTLNSKDVGSPFPLSAITKKSAFSTPASALIVILAGVSYMPPS